MSDSMEQLNAAIEEWAKRLEVKSEAVEKALDGGLMKAALFCEGAAKKNVMQSVYQNPIPTDSKGKPKWKRTGLLKASIGSQLDLSQPHCAVIFASAPYAKYVEFGTGVLGSEGDIHRPWGSGGYTMSIQGMRPRPFMYPAVFQNKQLILGIISNHLGKTIQ